MGRSIGQRTGGLPMPVVPTENRGIMSGPMRKPRGARRIDKRGSRRGLRGGMMQVTMRDPKTGQMYGGLVKDGVPQFKAPDGSTPQGFPKDIDISKIPVSRPISSLPGPAGRPAPGFIVPPGYKYNEIDQLVPIDTPPLGTPKPKFDPSKPSAVMETERVNVEDPTLGGPPEREVPIPKERDTSPRGPAPFSPDEKAMARDAFFEKMFSRADARKQQKDMEREDMRETRRAIKEERMARRSEPGEIDIDAERGGRRNKLSEREKMQVRRQKREFDRSKRTGRRRRRRDFTRRRSRMEGRRSREERAAFRDRYVSTLGRNFFS